LFAVTNFKVGEIDVDLGIGYGLTPAPTGLSYAFPRAWEGQEIRDRTEDTFWPCARRCVSHPPTR
jgi:hypothetical protein